jgi:hypothetical protein
MQMDLETIWYEYAPYLYATAGIVTIDQIGSAFGICVGALLLGGAAVVLMLRWNHRITRSRKDGIKTD